MKAMLNATLIVITVAAAAEVVWQWVEMKELRQAVQMARVLNQQFKQSVAKGEREATLRALRAAQAQRVQTQTARAQPGPRAAPLALDPDSRDPEKNFVRLENFQNVGQATPSAAFQTLIWAVRVGDDNALSPLLELSPPGRAKLQTYLDGLPAESKEKFGRPEKVVGLLLAMDWLKNEALQIGETSFTGADEAQLTIQRYSNGRAQRARKLPLHRGATGWRLPLTDAMLDDIPAGIAEASLHVSPPVK